MKKAQNFGINLAIIKKQTLMIKRIDKYFMIVKLNVYHKIEVNKHPFVVSILDYQNMHLNFHKSNQA